MKLHQTLHRNSVLARHRHTQPYAAVVLEGAYHEGGDNGRWDVQAGDVLIHLPFTSHFDRVSSQRTTVINLNLPAGFSSSTSHWRVTDPEFLLRIAERDLVEAEAALIESLRPGSAAFNEPVDQLAAELGSTTTPSVRRCADALGIRRETLYRWFTSAYGVSPTTYRVEARARSAWQAIVSSDKTLSCIALEHGFSDQAHMSRAVRALTGFPPRYWRAAQ